MSSIVTSTPPLKYIPTLMPYLEPNSPPPSNPIYQSTSLSNSPLTELITLPLTNIPTPYLTPELSYLPISQKSSKVISFYCIDSSRI